MNQERLDLLNAVMKTMKDFPKVIVDTQDYSSYFTIKLEIKEPKKESFEEDE